VSLSNHGYARTGHPASDFVYIANGLNQYASVGTNPYAYDANGNLVSDGSSTFVYDAENRLVSAGGTCSTTLAYDPLGRLARSGNGSDLSTRYLYDGDRLAAEYDAAGTLRRRYGWGPGVDEPVLQDEGGAMNCTGT